MYESRPNDYIRRCSKDHNFLLIRQIPLKQMLPINTLSHKNKFIKADTFSWQQGLFVAKKMPGENVLLQNSDVCRVSKVGLICSCDKVLNVAFV